jgi:hypothetical protein
MVTRTVTIFQEHAQKVVYGSGESFAKVICFTNSASQVETAQGWFRPPCNFLNAAVDPFRYDVARRFRTTRMREFTLCS